MVFSFNSILIYVDDGKLATTVTTLFTIFQGSANLKVITSPIIRTVAILATHVTTAPAILSTTPINVPSAFNTVMPTKIEVLTAFSVIFFWFVAPGAAAVPFVEAKAELGVSSAQT